MTFVLAFKSHYLKANVPNDYVASYVRKHSDRLIGFAAVDPSNPREAIADLRRATMELGMKGVTVWPAAQDFHPASSAAMRVYEEAARLRVPIVFHQNAQASAMSKMEYARPYLIDEVAREFPELKIIISQLGYPWIDEALVLLAKHRNVFAEISGLLNNPWQAYNAMLNAYQNGVMESLLFGSNFPYTSAATCIETLYSVNQFCHGTNLPTIPREQLRQIVERNALELLGIESAMRPTPRETVTSVLQNED
jgi:predicted TIM-barrel fold metal-dependent hydrolase